MERVGVNFLAPVYQVRFRPSLGRFWLSVVIASYNTPGAAWQHRSDEIDRLKELKVYFPAFRVFIKEFEQEQEIV